MIDARGVGKRFGRTRAVVDLTFAVPERCVAGLLGPNGAGKSTTIRMLAGLLVPDEGALVVDGIDLRTRPDEARARIGYLPESAPLHPELRTREFLRYRAALVGLVGRAARDAIDRVVVACDLGSVTGRLAGALSKGFRQRVGLAAAMLGDPRLLILDEPSVGLDPHQLQGFRRLIRALGRERTVLLSSHLLAEIEAVCDRAVLLREGRLVAEGSIADLVGGASGDASAVVAEVRGGAAAEVVAEVLGAGATALWSDFADGWRRVRVALSAERANDAAAALAAGWARRGVAVRELRRERGSLEDLFVRTTSGEGSR